ncbi:hypothetical protein O181_003784 [Austropuccinia psidii MF-1]|uniref:Uncharacterized protein n=1 Tax=Austropuccinia psidii MF-1 TaxID=1389203 RepID=A0A9Q3BEM5_9BASI|nr:hypothetical protein [Austropuccinia psidii MF-1]
MSSVHFRDLGVPRSQPEEREGLFTSKRPAFRQQGEFPHSYSPVNSTETSNQRNWKICIKYFSSKNFSKTCSSRAFKTEVKPGFTMGRNWAGF